MSHSASVPHAASRLEFLVQRLPAFERFHAGDARLRVNELVDLVERDDVLGAMRQGLETALTRSAQEWYEEGYRTSALPALPAEPAAACALRWALLRRLRQDKVDLRQFVASTCPGAHLNEKLMAWKRLVVHPLAHDLRALCELLGLRLVGEWADVEALTREALAGPFAARAFGPRAWDDEDDRRAEAEEEQARARPAPLAPAPTVGEPAPGPARVTWEQLVVALEAAIGTVAAPLVREDLLRDAQALRLEGWRSTRRPARILARVEAMARHPELAAACAELTRAAAALR